MIDAKRMEVFGAIYDNKLNTSLPEQALEINAAYLCRLIENHPTIRIGSAATKAKALLEDPSLYFAEQSYNILDNIQLAEDAFKLGLFEDTAYSSPAYLKEFFFKK